MYKELFHKDPRDFALRLVEDGLVSADTLLLAALQYMSHDDVRDMLDANEFSPRFAEDDEEEDEDSEEDEEWTPYNADYCDKGSIHHY